MKDSFVFYKSFYEAINKLPQEYQLELYKAITEYSFEGEITSELSPIAEAMFILMKPNIDSATQRYEASVENGKKGGAPKGNTNAKKQPKTTQKQPKNNLKQPSNNLNDNVNVNENVNVNVNDNDNVAVDVNKKATTANAFLFYLNNINSTPVPKEVEILESYQKDFSDELMIYAMEKAIENKARNLAYIKAILNKWKSKGITTLAEAKEEKQNKAPPQVLTNKYFDTENSAQYDNLDRFYAN